MRAVHSSGHAHRKDTTVPVFTTSKQVCCNNTCKLSDGKKQTNKQTNQTLILRSSVVRIHLEITRLRSEKLGPSRNGRMEQNIPVVPIFRNVRTTSRGVPKIPKFCSGKFPFHLVHYPEFPEFLVEWKAPRFFERARRNVWFLRPGFARQESYDALPVESPV